MTEPTTSGPPASEPPTPPAAEARLKEVDALLDDYERGLGLPTAFAKEIETEATALMNMPPAVLRKMSAVELGEAAFILRQFSFHLQRAVNRELSRVTWCEENIKAVIAKTVHTYRGVSFEERKLQAVRENDAAAKVDKLRVHAKLRVDRVSFLSAKAGDLSEMLKSLQFSKKGERQ
jgi:hypothetical protein